MTPKIGDFRLASGNKVPMIFLDALIPMWFQSKQYNIPVHVWVPTNFPSVAPMFYVKPSPTLHLKQGHPYVDHSGRCNFPFQAQWGRSIKSVRALCLEMSKGFTQHPPLYSGPPRPPPTSTYAPPPVSRPPPPVYPHGPPPPPPTSSAYAAPKPATSVYTAPKPAPSAYAAPKPAPGPPTYGEALAPGTSAAPPPAARPARSTREEGVDRATKLLRERLSLFEEAILRELDKVEAEHRKLLSRRQEMTEMLSRMDTERARLERSVSSLEAEEAALDEWISEHEHDPAPSADDVLPVPEGLPAQRVDLLARDAAIDDLLYTLNRALHDGTVTLDDYLRTVRDRAREQFRCRALARKIAAAAQS